MIANAANQGRVAQTPATAAPLAPTLTIELNARLQEANRRLNGIVSVTREHLDIVLGAAPSTPLSVPSMSGQPTLASDLRLHMNNLEDSIVQLEQLVERVKSI